MIGKFLQLVFVANLLGLAYLLTPRTLPDHAILEDIQIDPKIIIYAHPNLTREGCLALLRHYGRGLTRQSQVVIEKRSLDDLMRPCCVHNLDRNEILFHDWLFDPTHSLNRQPD